MTMLMTKLAQFDDVNYEIKNPTLHFQLDCL